MRGSAAREESISRGLKPDLWWFPDARTKVRAYLRSNGKSKSKSNSNGNGAVSWASTSHPSPSARRMGHPGVLGSLRGKNRQRQRQQQQQQQKQEQEQRQEQKRNAGVSPLRCAPVEMTASVGVRRRTGNGKSKIRGFFASLRMTKFLWMGQERTGNCKGKDKSKSDPGKLCLGDMYLSLQL